MDPLSRRVPWALAILGGLHGWFAGYRSPIWRQGYGWEPKREALPWLLALVFSAVFFLGGWLYFRKPRHARGSMWWAGAWILLSCAVLGFGPGAIPFVMGFPLVGLTFGLEIMCLALVVALQALPSAM